MQTRSARKRPTGRRAGDSGTRDAILDAARDLFAEQGYDRASMRAIAGKAGVDPALIRHFFTDKETLFATTMADRTTIPQRMAAALAGDEATLGARMTDAYLQLWEEPDTRPVLLGLVRSAMTSEHATEILVEVLGSRLRANADAPVLDSSRTRGVALAGAHLFGVAIARHVLRIPTLVDMPHAELVAEIAPTVQKYLTRPAD